MKINLKYSITLVLLIVTGCKFMTSSVQTEFVPAVTKVTDIAPLFPANVTDIKNRVTVVKKHIKEVIDYIIAIPADKRTFANTAKAFDNLGYQVGWQTGPISVLKMLHPDQVIIDACKEALLELQPFMQEQMSKNVALYRAFKEYVDGNFTKEELTAEQKYYVTELMKGFKQGGLELPADQLEEVKAFNNRIAELGLQFSGNINADATKVPLTEQELSGVPQQVLDGLSKDEQGRYLAGVDYPTFNAIMDNCKISETRRKIRHAFANRAYPVNEPILLEIIKLRAVLAQKLGFADYATYELYDEMIGTPQRAHEFLEQVSQAAKGKYAKEVETIAAKLPEGIKRNADGTINAWDWPYIKSQYKKSHLAIDDEVICQYFPVEHVIRAIFDIYQEFLGLRFEHVSLPGLWSSDVTAAAVYDKETNALRGYLLLDLFPRPLKYSHACMIPIVPAVKDAKGNLVPAVIGVVGNFPKATADCPALLKFADVNTFFHEFGHAMHGMVGATAIAGFSGTDVKRDFVEMPSQMFEEWLKDSTILQRVSKHYKTGQPLSEDLIKKLVEVDKFDSGDFVMRQLSFGLTSLDYFTGDGNVDLLAIQQKNARKTRPMIKVEEDDHQFANFGHLIGYGARYYGYMWSKVYAVDLADAVKKVGFTNPEIGKKLVDEVLGKGGSVDPNILLRSFLGREPNQEAFLRSLDFK